MAGTCLTLSISSTTPLSPARAKGEKGRKRKAVNHMATKESSHEKEKEELSSHVVVVLYFPDEIDAAVNLSFSFRTPSIS